MAKFTLSKRRRVWSSAIIALMAEPTIEAAAARLNIHLGTLETWIRDPDFIVMFNAAQDQALGLGIAQLQWKFSNCVQILDKIASDPQQPGSVRVAAVSKMMEVTTKAVAARSTSAYIKRLEDELRNLRGAGDEPELPDAVEAEADAEKEATKSAEATSLAAGSPLSLLAAGFLAPTDGADGEEAAEGDDSASGEET